MRELDNGSSFILSGQPSLKYTLKASLLVVSILLWNLLKRANSTRWSRNLAKNCQLIKLYSTSWLRTTFWLLCMGLLMSQKMRKARILFNFWKIMASNLLELMLALTKNSLKRSRKSVKLTIFQLLCTLRVNLLGLSRWSAKCTRMIAFSSWSLRRVLSKLLSSAWRNWLIDLRLCYSWKVSQKLHNVDSVAELSRFSTNTWVPPLISMITLIFTVIMRSGRVLRNSLIGPLTHSFTLMDNLSVALISWRN